MDEEFQHSLKFFFFHTFPESFTFGLLLTIDDHGTNDKTKIEIKRSNNKDTGGERVVNEIDTLNMTF